MCVCRFSLLPCYFTCFCPLFVCIRRLLGLVEWRTVYSKVGRREMRKDVCCLVAERGRALALASP